MKRILLITIAASIGLVAQAQEETQKPESPKWKKKAIMGLNATQASFVNWNAGGRNNLAALAFFNADANYLSGRHKWDNTLNLALGGIKYFDTDLQKTDDLIDIQSSYGFGLKKPWYFTVLAGFKTQFMDGFVFPNDSVRTSTFLAPGYGNLSLGIEYAPNDNFKAFLSPLSGKFTFVNDQVLADAGSFGVDGAVFDPTSGDVLTPGKNFRPELGAYLRVIYNKELMTNINLKSRAEFFTNYLQNPGNIDVNAEMILSFKVNKWFSAALQMNLLYDDDIDITDRDGNVGPRTQFKQVLSLGLTYSVQNYTEKK